VWAAGVKAPDFLKNIAGLWLLQECRRAWALEGREYTYAELAGMASTAPPFTAIIDPDAFLEPGGMPDKIAAFCRQHGQPVPETPAAMCRSILESLALRCRQVLESLESLLGRKLGVIHIVGGGSRNQVLNQFVADATGRPVVAGPAEATALGNVLVQAIGSGELKGLDEARRLIARSFPLERFEPRPQADWNAAYERFCRLKA
ncbi:MAG TPA: FGGY-family carbohydrate kinase, partial [Bryobacteraceae bacterium]|nr:FGGY-family carbohydrate kinase [Bryobacteraceae bacterium]